MPGAPSAGVVKIEKPTDKKLTIGSNLSPVTKKVNKSAREDEQTFEVKCVFKYDATRYQPSNVAGYNVEEGYEEYYDWENDYVYLYMTPGIYDFRATYYRVSDTSLFREEGTAYLILEDIEVKGDMEIELDASLITETISFETYNPDGEKTALRYLRYLNENWDWEIISEYNVYDFYCDNYIIHKEYGSFSNHGNAGGLEVEPGPCGEWRSEWASNVYINPVSDKYQIAQLRMLYDERECRIVPMFADGSHTQTVTNKGDKYSDLYDVNFAKTPAGKECDVVSDSPYSMYWGMNNALESPWSMWGLQSSLSSFHHFRFCQTSSSLLHPEYIYMMNFSGEDTAEIVDVYQDFDDEGNLIYEYVRYATTTIDTPMFVLGMESCELYPRINNYFLLLEEGGMESDGTFQRSLSFEVTPQSMPVFGSTPQFMLFYYQTYDSDWYAYPYPMLSYNSLDYYGDSCTSFDGEIKVSVNGDVVADSAEGLRIWQRECIESQMETGKLVFDYQNNNIEVDGLAGKNSAKVCIDNSVDNFTMPLIQSVQLRDGTNHVTDSFSDASEGKLLITGGDFREVKGEPINDSNEIPMWYDIELCDLTVEYAPYRSNDFTPIEVKPEGNAMIGFGYPYVGSLESVDKESSTGWFDLRILMTDAAGNTNEQIISPAFKIDRLTGIQQVSVNRANLRVIGRAVVADNDAAVEVFTLSGQRVENNNLPVGLYIARSGDSVAKLMVK